MLLLFMLTLIMVAILIVVTTIIRLFLSDVADLLYQIQNEFPHAWVETSSKADALR